MASINKVILIGNLGKDPEFSKTTAGRSIAKFSLATNETWYDKNGEKHERTEWHNIVAWDKRAELANQYLRKGRSIYIEGRLATSSWDQDGIKRYKTEIVVTNFEFLGSNSGRSDDTSLPNNNMEPASESSSVAEPSSIIEDDLPF